MLVLHKNKLIIYHRLTAMVLRKHGIAKSQYPWKKVGDLPSHQLLWFMESIYFDQEFEPLISQRLAQEFYPLEVGVG